MIKQVHNSLTVHDNSWTLKFYNFSDFQDVISDSAHPTPTLEGHYEALCTKTDKWLTPFLCVSRHLFERVFTQEGHLLQ